MWLKRVAVTACGSGVRHGDGRAGDREHRLGDPADTQWIGDQERPGRGRLLIGD